MIHLYSVGWPTPVASSRSFVVTRFRFAIAANVVAQPRSRAKSLSSSVPTRTGVESWSASATVVFTTYANSMTLTPGIIKAAHLHHLRLWTKDDPGVGRVDGHDRGHRACCLERGRVHFRMPDVMVGLRKCSRQLRASMARPVQLDDVAIGTEPANTALSLVPYRQVAVGPQ